MPRRTEPTIYPRLRHNALSMELPQVGNDAVQIVLMDWHLERGTATVVAGADGSASFYLSSGAGFAGGGEQHPGLRAAALHAVAVATSLLSQFEPTDTVGLPALGDVAFYLRKGRGFLVAVAAEARLRAGTDPLALLGGAMQKIVTEYRAHGRAMAAQPGSPAQG